MSMALHSEEEAIINGGNKMNKAKCMKLHSHPGMEVKLGVPTDHVIIDSDIYHHILNIQPSFAEPKPKPRDIEHDRAICERMVKEDNCWDLDCEDCPLYDKGQLPGEDFSCKKLDGFIAPAKKWLTAHPKPKPSPEVFKVRITGCKDDKFWYSKKIGEVFDVEVGGNGRWQYRELSGTGYIADWDCELVTEEKEVLTVRITGCSGKAYWYSERVGETFDVTKENILGYEYKQIVINKKDTEIIP